MQERNEKGQTLEEFLDVYQPGDYERPSVTVDIMVVRMSDDLEKLKVLLIKRKDHPYINQWALPGGFIGINESAYEAACRELKEETGLDGICMEQLYTMSSPDRDPRMRVISIAYMAIVPYDVTPEIQAGDDAGEAEWFDLYFDKRHLMAKNGEVRITYDIGEYLFTNGNLRENSMSACLSVWSSAALAFDHEDILLKGISRLRKEVENGDAGFILAPEYFTLVDLHKIHETIMDITIYSKNFRDKMRSNKLVVATGKKQKPVGGVREAAVYMYRNRKRGEDAWDTV